MLDELASMDLDGTSVPGVNRDRRPRTAQQAAEAAIPDWCAVQRQSDGALPLGGDTKAGFGVHFSRKVLEPLGIFSA